MAVIIETTYDGDLQCTAVHGPTGHAIQTDAPPDNHGLGRYFSPTDLLAAAAGTCVLTVMAIAARARGWELRGARARVEKEMSAVPRRHIGRLGLTITLPASLDARARELLETTARTCPVAASLGTLTELALRFEYVDMPPER